MGYLAQRNRKSVLRYFLLAPVGLVHPILSTVVGHLVVHRSLRTAPSFHERNYPNYASSSQCYEYELH
jgi:hypothetical protein